MYVGYFLHAVDKKNRIFIPYRFRSGKNNYVLSRGLEKCLWLFDSPRWSQILDKFENLSWQDKSKQRAFKRTLLAGAVECGMDSQGRLIIPSHLMEYADIRKESSVIGMGDRIEIWDSDVWKKYSADFGEKSFAALAEKLDI